jgi:hypothetical protein
MDIACKRAKNSMKIKVWWLKCEENQMNMNALVLSMFQK